MALLHVGPVFTSDDLSDHYLADAVFIRKCSLGDIANGMSSPNSDDLFFTESRRALTTSTRPAILCNFISDILGVCSKKQMGWVATRAIVAPVQNVEAIWNIAVGQMPRHAMCANGSRARFRPAKCVKTAIAARVCKSQPWPTCVRSARLIDFGPEAVRNRGGTLKRHRELPLSVSFPRAVRAVAGVFGCHNFTTGAL